jgi:hypothetical protein
MGGDAYRNRVCRTRFWANPTRVQGTEEDFVARIVPRTNNVGEILERRET